MHCKKLSHVFLSRLSEKANQKRTLRRFPFWRPRFFGIPANPGPLAGRALSGDMPQDSMDKTMANKAFACPEASKLELGFCEPQREVLLQDPRQRGPL